MDDATLKRSALDSKVSRTYVLRGDRIEQADGLDRGAPIVWSVAQWRSRYRAMRKKETRLGILFVGSMLFITSVVFWALTAPYDPGILASGIVQIGSLFLLCIVIAVLAEYLSSRRPPAVTHHGLYERGIQVNRALFLPYDELGDVVVMGSMVRLTPRSPLEKGPWLVPNPQQWFVERDLLGEGGLRELKARVSGERPKEEPPKLVLYGPPGYG